MNSYQTTIAIAALPEQIWRLLTDVEHWNEWTASITRVERLDPTAFAAGSRFKVFQPRLRPAVWAVTALKPGSSFTWESRNPGLKVVAEHVIEPAGDGKCTVTLRTTFSGLLAPIVGRLSGALTREYMGLEAAGLKQRSEGQG